MRCRSGVGSPDCGRDVARNQTERVCVLYVGVMLVLALVRAKAVHYALVLLLLVVMVLGWFPLRIQ